MVAQDYSGGKRLFNLQAVRERIERAQNGFADAQFHCSEWIELTARLADEVEYLRDQLNRLESRH